MAIDITEAGATVRNETTISGAPAVAVLGAGANFVNGAAGRVISTDANSPAILISGDGATIINQVGGIIRGTNTYPLPPVITGSAGSDVVDDFGLIVGRISLGGGSDSFTEHLTDSVYSHTVSLGEGDDVYRGSGPFNYFAPTVSGDGGYDRFSLEGAIGQANGVNVIGFEQLEVGPSVPTGQFTTSLINILNFSGFERVILAPGAQANFSGSLNPAADLVQTRGMLTIGSYSQFRSVTGGEGAEWLELGGGSAISGAIALGGGDDMLRVSVNFSSDVPPTFGRRVDGGTGRDILELSSSPSMTLDLTAFTNFEVLAATYYSSGNPIKVLNGSGFNEIWGPTERSLTLDHVDASGAYAYAGSGGTLVLQNGTTLGRYGYAANGPYDDLTYVAQGDDRRSVRLVNNATILGEVKLGIGDDSYDGSGGSVGGIVYGYAGNDRLTGGNGIDRLDGGFGADIMRGGSGADILTGGPGVDSFAGTRAGLAGDRITDFAIGERILVTDVTFPEFGFTRVGTTLSVGAGATLALEGLVGRLVLETGTDGGVDLVAVNRYTGLNDFGGDGHSDIVWQNANGAISTWGVTGNTRLQLAQNTYLANVDASWKVAETFDMDGDSRSDILWRNDNGTFSVWQASGNGFQQGSYTDGSVGNVWALAATGDINGDGKDDLLFRNQDGSISSWNSTGTAFAQNSYFHASVGTNWKVEGLADFNGDGKDDLLWRNDNGALTIWNANGSGFTENSYFDASVPAGTGWHIAGLGDFSGDGRDDVIWRNDNGAVSVWQAAGTNGFDKGTFNTAVSTDWSIAQVGDFNADGKADLLWHNTNGAISIWQSNGNGFDQNTLYDAGAPTSWQIQAHDFLI